MNHYLDSKVIVIGLIISLTTAVISLTLAPVLYPQNDSSAAFKGWDLESPRNLALSMDQSLPNLIYSSVLTGIVTSAYIENTQSWVLTVEPFFLSKIGSFQYSPIIDSNMIDQTFLPSDPIFQTLNWKLDYFICCPSEDKSINLPNMRDFQEELQNGLSQDINGFNDLTNITFTLNEVREKAEMQENVFYWEIRHVYSDGTKLEIHSYGSEIIIEQIHTVEILFDENGLSFKSDPEKSPFPSYHTVTLDNPFERYENVINDALKTIIDSNG